MLFWIAIIGGLTLLMGQHTRSESLFYYFRLEDQVPENHPLRLVDKHIELGFVRERLRYSYSDTIDPVLLRVLLIDRFHGIAKVMPLTFKYNGVFADAKTEPACEVRVPWNCATKRR